ncbi:MAG: hypothetical protein PHW82_13850, partial [Bacteroidales bacterium]|nr:hypothetical protein [Bacteroidales bacterium]
QEKENQRQIEFAKLQLQQQEQHIQEKQKLELEAKQNQFKFLISQAQSLFDNNDFKTAMSKIVEAEALNLENDSHLDLKLQIDKSIDLQTKNDAIEKLKQERAEKRIAETKEKLQGGLASYLEEKNLKNEFKVNKFGILKAKVEKYLKDSAQEKLPENELIVLEQCIKRVYNSLKNREQKKWQKFDNNNIWQTIANWSNSDFTKNIYDKLF